jgi:transcriptional regulator with XRE-family HTH domain
MSTKGPDPVATKADYRALVEDALNDSTVARKGPGRLGRPPGPQGPRRPTATAGETGRPRASPPPGTFAGRLGECIRARRFARGLTLEAASDRTLGMVSLNMWSSYEMGEHRMRIDNFLMICAALECRPEEILPDVLAQMYEARVFDYEQLRRLFQRDQHEPTR